MAFFQGFGVVFYISLVALFMANAERLFGKVPEYLGPMLFLSIFSTSALVCAILTLYFPFMLFFQKKQVNQAVRLVVYTAGWMIFFTLLIISMIFLTKV